MTSYKDKSLFFVKFQNGYEPVLIICHEVDENARMRDINNVFQQNEGIYTKVYYREHFFIWHESAIEFYADKTLGFQ